jgi:Na+-transporting NADH:ubiquinone oxidoreductase subunit NqrC
VNGLNTSLATADRMTHLKIVVVSLIASILVIAVAVAARPTSVDTRLQASGPVIKANKLIAVTGRESTTIR